MRKTLKKLVATALLVVGVLSSTMVATAKSSGWISSPGTICGNWTSGESKKVTVTTDQDAITADRITLKIDSFKTLPTEFSAGSRTMGISIYDDDVNNADDLVKKYKGYIYTRSLAYVYEDTSYKLNDTIDAYDDNGAELYINFMIPRLAGDPEDAWLYSGWFKYMFEAKSEK